MSGTIAINQLRATILDCYRYREVLYNILSRDLKVKYKRTALGYFWSLLNPILQLAVMTMVFSHFVGRGMKDYTLYLFSGLLAWTFFQTSIIMASTSLLENENFIKKIYLPKMLFPVSKLCLRAIDFIFSLLALSLLGLVTGYAFKVTFVLVPLCIVLLFLFTLGLSLFVSVATVYFRDIQYLLQVFMQLLYFATPILYEPGALPPKYQAFVYLNPVYSQVHLFQKLIYYGQIPTQAEWLSGITVALAAFVLGVGTLMAFEEDLVFRL